MGVGGGRSVFQPISSPGAPFGEVAPKSVKGFGERGDDGDRIELGVVVADLSAEALQGHGVDQHQFVVGAERSELWGAKVKGRDEREGIAVGYASEGEEPPKSDL